MKSCCAFLALFFLLREACACEAKDALAALPAAACQVAARAYFEGLVKESRATAVQANNIYSLLGPSAKRLEADEKKLRDLLPGAYPRGVAVFYVDADRSAYSAAQEDVAKIWREFSTAPAVVVAVKALAAQGYVVEFRVEELRIGFRVLKPLGKDAANSKVDLGWRMSSAKYTVDPSVETAADLQKIAADPSSLIATQARLSAKLASYGESEIGPLKDFEQMTAEWRLKRKFAEATLATFVGDARRTTPFSLCSPDDLISFYREFKLRTPAELSGKPPPAQAASVAPAVARSLAPTLKEAPTAPQDRLKERTPAPLDGDSSDPATAAAQAAYKVDPASCFVFNGRPDPRPAEKPMPFAKNEELYMANDPYQQWLSRHPGCRFIGD